MSQQAPLLDVDPQVRRAFDYYPTPRWMTRALMRRCDIYGSVLEPCAGDGAIVDVFKRGRDRRWLTTGAPTAISVVTNDIDPIRDVQYRLDATTPAAWACLPHCLWTVTNPPFDVANAIVPLAVERLYSDYDTVGVAMLLRLSWLEPTEARAGFLKTHPPTQLIVMPRHDFKGRGATDSVTSGWFVWSRGVAARGIEIVTKDERDELIAQYGKA